MYLELNFEETFSNLSDEKREVLYFDKVLKYIDRGQQLPNLIDISSLRTESTLKSRKRFSTSKISH